MTTISKMPLAILPLSGSELVEVIQNGRNRKVPVSSLPGGGGSGTQGTQGTSGSNGTQGTQGTSGSNGTQGTSGIQGSTGSQGAPSPRGCTIMSPIDGDVIILFKTQQTITISKLTGLMLGGVAPVAVVSLFYGPDMSTPSTILSGVSIDSITSGNVWTSFINSTVPIGNFVWFSILTVTGFPTSLHITMEY